MLQKKYILNFIRSVFLLFLHEDLQCTIAQTDPAVKGHWNPNSIEMYHGFYPSGLPERKREIVDSRINYQGWNYAGRSEFPWLVEIRGNDSEKFEQQKEWSNGNLVTGRFVLTVCEAVAEFTKYEREPKWREGDDLFGVRVNHYYLTPKNPKYYKVLYSDDYTYKSVDNGYYTGTRRVKRFIPHPKCNTFELDFQWGVVQLERSIYPVPPWTSYMPTDFSPNGYNSVKQIYMGNRLNLVESSPCQVGLWSRKLETVYDIKDKDGKTVEKTYENNVMLNYKVKYFVRPTDPRDCWYSSAPKYPDRFGVGETLGEWECWAINANETLGVVCDRDRGAPIVCDGIVRAVVLTGAKESDCTMKKAYPFLVLDIKYALGLFSEISNKVRRDLRLRDYLRVNEAEEQR